MADIADGRARSHLRDAEPHAVVGHVAQAPRCDRWVADKVHSAGVAVEAVLNHGHVDVQHVAVLERFVARNAVAHLVVDRGADGLGKGPIARRRVVQRGRHRVLNAGHVVMAQTVELTGGDTGLDVRGHEVQDFGGQPAGHAHSGDFFGCLDHNGHESVFSAEDGYNIRLLAASVVRNREIS